MRQMLIALVLLAALPAGPARADDGQAYLGIFAETHVMRMAGMPAMPDIPELPEGIKLPPGVKLPGGGGMAVPGRPARRLEVRLWSPGLAPGDATASLAIPAGLKLGDKLDLGLYRPKAEEGKVEFGKAGTPAGFTIKRYWGSSPTVKDGQPDVFRWEDLTAEQKAVMREQAERTQSKGSYFYKPNWTTGYWPAGDSQKAVAKDAAMPGHYALTTTYTGNVEIDVPDKVSFLAPIDLSSPDLAEAVALDKAIEFRWASVPNILGYHAAIMGMEGQNTLVIWTSSEIKTDPGTGWDYMQMAEVAERVKSTAMMAPDRTTVTVPAGIFKDCDFVSLMMVGYGPGAALDKAQPLPRVQTKTTLQVMLGGKKMPRMPGPGDGGGDSQ